MLIKEDIKDVKTPMEHYPESDRMESQDKCIGFLPESL
jgi:hypothetical protein